MPRTCRWRLPSICRTRTSARTRGVCSAGSECSPDLIVMPMLPRPWTRPAWPLPGGTSRFARPSPDHRERARPLRAARPAPGARPRARGPGAGGVGGRRRALARLLRAHRPGRCAPDPIVDARPAGAATAGGLMWHAIQIPAAMGDFLRNAGDIGPSAALLRTGLSAARRAGDRAGQALALRNLGMLSWLSGDFRMAARSLAEAVELYDAAVIAPARPSPS